MLRYRRAPSVTDRGRMLPMSIANGMMKYCRNEMFRGNLMLRWRYEIKETVAQEPMESTSRIKRSE